MLKKLKPKSEFSHNVLTLMTGTSIARAIPIAISPILTRIYTPSDYGILALFMSISSMATIIATGRYELAIMMPKRESDAINIMFISIIISFFISLLIFVIVFIFNDDIVKLLSAPEISLWLYLIPISVLLSGIYQSFNYWHNRHKYYKKIAITNIVQSGTGSSMNLGFGMADFGGSGLIISTVISQCVGTVLLVKSARKNNRFLKYISNLKVLALLKKYKKLPLLNLPNALIDTFRLTGINILIAKFFTTSVLGQFSLSWRMVQLPMGLIGSSLSQVFFQKISSSPKSELHLLVKKFILRASLISAPAFLILYFFSVDIFMFIFGNNWKLAGEATSAMAPWLFLNFITSPLSTLFIVLNRQEIMLIFSIFYMVIPLSVLVFLQDKSFINVMHIISLFMSVQLLIFIFIVLKITKWKSN